MKLRAWAAALVGALAAWGAPRLLHSQSVDDAGDASLDGSSLDAAVDAVESDAIADAEAPTEPQRRPYDHVVIVSFDGMRPDGMERADAPTLHRLRAEGTYALQAETVGDSSTLPSHSSMISGWCVHSAVDSEIEPRMPYFSSSFIWRMWPTRLP